MKRLTAFILLITILTLTGPGAQVRVWAEEKTSAQAAGTGEEAAVPGAELRMLANAQGSQMLGVVIYSEDGRTVVIDGGCDDDGDHKKKRRRGGCMADHSSPLGSCGRSEEYSAEQGG